MNGVKSSSENNENPAIKLVLNVRDRQGFGKGIVARAMKKRFARGIDCEIVFSGKSFHHI